MKLEIDYSKDKLLTDFSKKTLQDRYLVGDEKSPQEAFARAAAETGVALPSTGAALELGRDKSSFTTEETKKLADP